MQIEGIGQIEAFSEHTTKEIFHQPSLWKKIWEKVQSEKDEINSFLNKAIQDCDSIILTGAGTSAYIGLTAQRTYRRKFGKIAEPISTTHIVSHPQDYFLPSKSIMLVSFARSGNSPESCEAVNLANQNSKNAKHLIITCNPGGKLAIENKGKDNAYTFVLPPEANDKSLAMTSSFTGMILASILIARIDEIDTLEKGIEKLIEYCNTCLEKAPALLDIAQVNFKRTMYLGSGPLYGIAKEAQLKMQELTDGLVICKHDSFLGLRHGPKAVIDADTLIVLHLTSNCHAKKYENDLVSTMKINSNPIGQLAIGEDIEESDAYDWLINFDSKGEPLDIDLLSVVSVVPSQLLALFKSIQLGLTPDNPSRNGAISRVVQGVSIHQLLDA